MRSLLLFFLILRIVLILLILFLILNLIQPEYYTNYNNNNNNEFVQRTTGIPIPGSISQEDPVFISGTGQTSNRLVGATQIVYGNNGSVSCTTYCGGTNYEPWNGELPKEWFGAKCIKTSNVKYGCDAEAGIPIQCTCAPNGAGWNA